METPIGSDGLGAGRGLRTRAPVATAFLYSAAAVAIATGIGMVIQSFITMNVDLVLLLAVLFSAIRFGLIPSLVTAALATLALDFFFVDPLYTLEIADPRDVVSLAFFAIIAIATSNLAGELQRQMRRAETERLRNAMLTSISHDLRTPLSSIIGAVTSLRSFGTLYSVENRDDLLATIQDEAERLNRFIGNLLDMTRLEAGGIRATEDAVDIADVANSAAACIRRLGRGQRIELDLDDDLPLAQADFVLLEQSLFNLLDNATKYAEPETTVTLHGTRQGGFVVLDVIDEGPGIPSGQTEAIFDKFTRLQQGDRQRAGTGLSLAIARGFATAMGGTIAAANRTDRRGAVFRLRLPVAAIERRFGAEGVVDHG